MSSQDQEDQVPVQEDTIEQTNIDAQAEDDLVSSGSADRQLQAEASELNQDNIIDDSPGVSTRGAKIDATKQVCFHRLLSSRCRQT